METAAAISFWGAVLAVLYCYAGYPLLIALLAAVRPRPVSRDDRHTPDLTILIAAYNEEESIAGKLENTFALDYPPGKIQVVVAADGSDDRTAQIVREFAPRGVLLNHRPGRAGKLAAINRALPLCLGEVVVFSDANNLYHPRTLRELAAFFADPSVGAVGGAKVILQEGGALDASEGLYWRYESFIKERESRAGCCVAVAGEILAVRRTLLHPLPEDIIQDDFTTAMEVVRQGFRVVYAPRARSAERVSPSASDEVVRRRRIVTGRLQSMALSHRFLSLRRPLVLWEVLSHKFLRPLVPLAMLAALAANLLLVGFPAPPGPWAPLRLAPPWAVVALALQGAFYLAAIAGNLLRQRGPAGRALYLATFLVNSNWAAFVGICDYFFGRDSVLWPRAARRRDAGGSPEP